MGILWRISHAWGRHEWQTGLPSKLEFTKRHCVFYLCSKKVFEHKINFCIDAVRMVCFPCVWPCFICVSFEFTLGSCVFTLSSSTWWTQNGFKSPHQEHTHTQHTHTHARTHAHAHKQTNQTKQNCTLVAPICWGCVSHMRALLTAFRQLAVNDNAWQKVLYVFEHKT